MTKKLIMPVGWPCKLQDCPPGPFVTGDHPHLLCFKSEYSHGNSGNVMAFNSAGEYFHGQGNDHMVQPVEMIEVDDD